MVVTSIDLKNCLELAEVYSEMENLFFSLSLMLQIVENVIFGS